MLRLIWYIYCILVFFSLSLSIIVVVQEWIGNSFKNKSYKVEVTEVAKANLKTPDKQMDSSSEQLEIEVERWAERLAVAKWIVKSLKTSPLGVADADVVHSKGDGEIG